MLLTALIYICTINQVKYICKLIAGFFYLLFSATTKALFGIECQVIFYTLSPAASKKSIFAIT
jgi:hypothetical protein